MFKKISLRIYEILNTFSNSPEMCFQTSRVMLCLSVFLQYLFAINELNYLFLSDAIWYKVLYFLFLASLICVLLNYKTAFFVLLCAVLHVVFTTKNQFVFGGWSAILPFIFFVHFCLEINRNNIKKNPQLISYYVGALLSFTSIIYFNSNYPRMFQPDWLNGSMVEFILSDTFFSRVYHLPQLEYFKPYLKYVSYLTLLLECLGAFLVFLPFKFRRVLIFSLIGLHLSILVLAKVQIWSLVMIALLVLGLCKMPWENSKNRFRHPIFFRTALVYLLFLAFSLTSYYYPYKNQAAIQWLAKTHLFGLQGTRVFMKKKPVYKYRTRIYSFEKNDPKLLYDTENKHINSPEVLENSILSHVLHFRYARGFHFLSDARKCEFYRSLFQNKSSFVVVLNSESLRSNQHRRTRMVASICDPGHDFEFKNIGFQH